MRIDPETIGRQIRAARKKAGLTQGRVAELTGIPSRTYWEYENGRIANPAREAMQAIARLLDVPGLPELFPEEAPAVNGTAEPAPPPEWQAEMKEIRDVLGRVLGLVEKQGADIDALKKERVATGQPATTLTPGPGVPAELFLQVRPEDKGFREAVASVVPGRPAEAQGKVSGQLWPAVAFEIPGKGMLLLRVSFFVEGLAEPVVVTTNLGAHTAVMEGAHATPVNEGVHGDTGGPGKARG